MIEICTRHAARRAQQRAINDNLMDLLWDFGSEMRHAGADVLFFDGAARRRIARELGGDALRQFGDGALDCYAVLADTGHIITVGHRSSRFRRHVNPARPPWRQERSRH